MNFRRSNSIVIAVCGLIIATALLNSGCRSTAKERQQVTQLPADNSEPVCTATAFSLNAAEIADNTDQANHGNAGAAFRLYLYYDLSEYSPTNRLYWLKRAVELGHPIAKYNLAYCYEYDAPTKNYKEALKLYREIADTDNDAMVAIAGMYQEGKGVDVSTNLAIEWYEKAANRGKMFAMQNAAVLLKNENQPERAYVWAKIADLRCQRNPQVRHDVIFSTNFLSNLSSNTIARLDEQAKNLDKQIPYIENYVEW